MFQTAGERHVLIHVGHILLTPWIVVVDIVQNGNVVNGETFDNHEHKVVLVRVAE